jgi:hypothetical protein
MRIFRFTAVRTSAIAHAAISVTLLTVNGCASLGPVQLGVAGGGGAAPIALPGLPDSSPAPPPPSPFPSQGNDMMPRMIIPATGGLPVLGIPLGGSMFLPVTGGLPVVGIPLSP